MQPRKSFNTANLEFPGPNNLPYKEDGEKNIRAILPHVFLVLGNQRGRVHGGLTKTVTFQHQLPLELSLG
jgi:hypothetical protein